MARSACWWAQSSGTLSSATITFTSSSSSGGTIVYIFAVSGVNFATPFDPNVGAAIATSGSSGTASAPVTTTNANDLIIGVVGISASHTISAGGSFTILDRTPDTQSGADETNLFLALEHTLLVSLSLPPIGLSLLTR